MSLLYGPQKPNIEVSLVDYPHDYIPHITFVRSQGGTLLALSLIPNLLHVQARDTHPYHPWYFCLISCYMVLGNIELLVNTSNLGDLGLCLAVIATQNVITDFGCLLAFSLKS